MTLRCPGRGFTPCCATSGKPADSNTPANSAGRMNEAVIGDSV
jgi:hypothetical protein